jgi:poly-gamma-glutamate synthesis protein (capsule biosynthesis protein)
MRAGRLVAAAGCLVVVTACSSTTGGSGVAVGLRSPSPSGAVAASSTSAPNPSPTPTDTRPPGEFTFSFAGDVNFEKRTADRLAADPSTAFGVATPVLSAADLTMVNLETAITTSGSVQNKEFTFRAPPVAFTALKDAGVDVATMANNHGADYGASGLADTLTAIGAGVLPVVGIGANSAAAYAPWVTTVRGVKIAVIAASQVQDETLANFTAGPSKAGIASAFSPLLIAAVKAAKAAGDVVITYIHWGTEYTSCPNANQKSLATQLAAAGASAVIGTHAHLLQGAGWRPDGTYVAYGLGNYLWWESFGNNQDDNGVLTLTFAGGKVVSDSFAPSHLDSTGVPVPATGATLAHINTEWAAARACSGLAASAP